MSRPEPAPLKDPDPQERTVSTKVRIGETAMLLSLSSMRSLTPLQQQFVLHYLATFDGPTAVVAAGSTTKRPSNMAWKMLQSSAVQKALLDCRARVATRLNITAESVLENLAQTVDEARQDGSYGAAISGLRLVSEYLGMVNHGRSNQPDEGRKIVEAEFTEADDRTEQERLADFADDIEAMAEQLDVLEESVELLVERVRSMAGEVSE